MSDEPSYWEKAYRDASPSRVVLWAGRHCHLVRLIAFSVEAAIVALVVSAAVAGHSLLSPITCLVTWSFQTFLWGFYFPVTADRWHARQTQTDAQQVDRAG